MSIRQDFQQFAPNVNRNNLKNREMAKNSTSQQKTATKQQNPSDLKNRVAHERISTYPHLCRTSGCANPSNHHSRQLAPLHLAWSSFPLKIICAVVLYGAPRFHFQTILSPHHLKNDSRMSLEFGIESTRLRTAIVGKITDKS